VKLALLIILINIANAVRIATHFPSDRLAAVVLQGYSPFWIQTLSFERWYPGVDKSIDIATQYESISWNAKVGINTLVYLVYGNYNSSTKITLLLFEVSLFVVFQLSLFNRSKFSIPYVHLRQQFTTVNSHCSSFSVTYLLIALITSLAIRIALQCTLRVLF
jgi:hypothetical protein